MDHAVSASVRNRLLAAAFPDPRALPRGLKRVPLTTRQVLIEPDQPIEHVYFPEGGIVSVFAETGEGDSMEIAMIGAEGMVGLPIIHGVDRSPHCSCVQVAGEALLITARDLEAAMVDHPALRKLLLRYAEVAFIQSAQVAVCNARHRLECRLAHWLLQAHERLDGDRIPLTHDALGQLLGVRRAGVTSALQTLESAGAIYHGRGRITVHDRDRLEELVCTCYRRLKTESQRLLG